MSNPYETIRVDLTTLVADFHTTHYPTTEINYPNKLITDVEHAVNPFVRVEIGASMRRIALGTKCFKIEGRLVLNFFARKNSGSRVFSTYTDKLVDYFSVKVLNGIIFQEVTPTANKILSGWDGEMNVIPFERDYYKI